VKSGQTRKAAAVVFSVGSDRVLLYSAVPCWPPWRRRAREPAARRQSRLIFARAPAAQAWQALRYAARISAASASQVRLPCSCRSRA